MKLLKSTGTCRQGPTFSYPIPMQLKCSLTDPPFSTFESTYVQLFDRCGLEILVRVFNFNELYLNAQKGKVSALISYLLEEFFILIGFTFISSPDSLNADRSDKSALGSASPQALYKLVVPLLRCEVADVRDAAVNALGMINHDALKDIMEELVVYIREAVDRKQENMRRRRRRDALRLQLVRVLEKIAENGTFGVCTADEDDQIDILNERDTMSLHPTFVEYIEGAMQYLISETDKDNISILESCATLLTRDLKRNLFNLFATWCGLFSKPLGITSQIGQTPEEEKLQFSALQAMSALLCCGHVFYTPYLSDDGIIYKWLDMLLTSKDEKIYQLARDTVVLLLESNPDMGQLLEWVIDRCYTSTSREADACFLALASIFSARRPSEGRGLTHFQSYIDLDGYV
uniref:Uncharacterized protein n=1 Tax=Glossina austeni TaxID=7395 RepID=A0A1A9UFY5_GLOAU